MDNKKISLDDIINEKAKSIDERVKEGKSSTATPIPGNTNNSSSQPNERRIITDVSEIKPMSEEVDGNKAMEEYYYQKIDDAIERTKKTMYEERIKPFQDRCKELAEEAEFNGDESVKELADMVSAQNPDQPNLVYDLSDPNLRAELEAKKKEQASDEPEVSIEVEDTRSLYRSDIQTTDVSNPSLKDDMLGGQDVELDMRDFYSDNEDNPFDLDDASLDEDNKVEDEAKRLEEQANQKRLLEQLRTKVNDTVVTSQLDLSTFTIGDKNVSINATMDRVAKESSFNQVQSVPLYDTGRMISFTPLSGSDIVKMSNEAYDSRLDSLQKTYAVIYAHDASIDKNKVSFTNWLKSISAADILQLYFGLYKATFSGSNYIAYKCDECDNFFMVKRDIKDMWSVSKDATPEQVERLKAIEEHGEVEDNLNARFELYQVSDNYAILIHPRTLYNTLEIEHLDQTFRRKYAAIVQPMQYIDKVYYIDKARNRLVPIEMHPVKDSIMKTVKNKCIVIHKMISAISTDQYSMLTGKLATLNLKEAEASNIINYHIPKQECLEVYSKGDKAGQKCTNVIEEEDMSPYSMLFTRHQLYINTTLTV